MKESHLLNILSETAERDQRHEMDLIQNADVDLMFLILTMKRPSNFYNVLCKHLLRLLRNY